MARREFRHVISLGTHCYISDLLHRRGLRHAAGPFDWIFSDPEMQAACFADRFESFLDPKQYMAVETREGIRFGHRDYSSRFSLPIIFNHHDPRTEKDYQHFVRSAARMDAVLDGQDPALFVCLTPPRRAREEALATLEAAVLARNRNAHLLIVVAEAAQQAIEWPVLQMRQQTATMEVFHLVTTTPHKGGLSYENPADEQVVSNLIDRFVLPMTASSHPGWD